MWGQRGVKGGHVCHELEHPMQEEVQFSHHLLLKKNLNHVKIVQLDDFSNKMTSSQTLISLPIPTRTSPLHSR